MGTENSMSTQFLSACEIPFSTEEVFAWHLLPGAVNRLIPPWTHAQVLSACTPDHLGSLVEIRLQYGPFFKNWIVKHIACDPNRSFTDEQVSGPFRYWKHRHVFEAITPDSCRVADEIEFRSPFPSMDSWIKRELARFFHYRHAILKSDLATYTAYPRTPLNILLSGSHGFIGSALVRFLQLGGHNIMHLSRSPSDKKAQNAIYWNPETGDVNKEDFEGFDAVIHLAGENIAGMRWTEKKKEKIFLSRARDTWLLTQVLNRLYQPPKVLIAASAYGFYGDRGEETLTEASSSGKGFLADVCRRWEAATDAIAQRGTRVAHARFGNVLSPSGGMLQKLLPTYKLGLGGKLGSGEQWLPWITLDDVLGSLYHILFTQELEGPVNCCAPKPIRQKEFASQLARTLRRPALGNLPAGLLRLLFGEVADALLLSSGRALPEKLLKSGYAFRFSDLSAYLAFAFGLS